MVSPAARLLLDHAPPEFSRAWSARLAWRLRMHSGQVPPLGDWRGWVLQAGRGFGKTLTGAVETVEHCLDHGGCRYGVIAPTLGDARDTAIEGETGLLAVLGEGNDHHMGMGLTEGRDFTYNRSRLELELGNGAHIKAFGSEVANRLRGPNHHRLWFEELASFGDAYRGDVMHTTFNNAMLGLRLTGEGPTRYMVTTTPRPVALITDLVSRPGVVVTSGTTFDNLGNLAPSFAAEIMRYQGTHLGRQELLGEILTEMAGALWRYDWFSRLDEVPEMTRLVIGVDPSGGRDETGIVAAGKIRSPCPCGGTGTHFAVIADATSSGSPEVWARRVTDLYHELEADRVVAERNFGGDMVASTIAVADRTVPVKMVTASRGKAVRAEPISLLYQQGRVHHVGVLDALESQLTSWVPGESGYSPDRLDALTWAITELGPAETGTVRWSGSTSRLPERVG